MEITDSRITGWQRYEIKEVGKGTGISFDNYSSEYFYYDDSDSAFVFNTPVSAPKTVNTKYARSELREMMGDDKTVNWDWNGDIVLMLKRQ